MSHEKQKDNPEVKLHAWTFLILGVCIRSDVRNINEPSDIRMCCAASLSMGYSMQRLQISRLSARG
jgi:hypothetical protein